MKRKKLSATVPLSIDKHSSPLTTSWQTNRRQITAPQLQTTPQLQEAPFPIESSSPPLTPLHGVVRHPRTTSTRIWNCHLCILSDTPSFEFCHSPSSFIYALSTTLHQLQLSTLCSSNSTPQSVHSSIWNYVTNHGTRI